MVLGGILPSAISCSFQPLHCPCPPPTTSKHTPLHPGLGPCWKWAGHQNHSPLAPQATTLLFIGFPRTCACTFSTARCSYMMLPDCCSQRTLLLKHQNIPKEVRSLSGSDPQASSQLALFIFTSKWARFTAPATCLPPHVHRNYASDALPRHLTTLSFMKKSHTSPRLLP